MNNDLISREALKEDFKSRLAFCNEWIEKAKDKETKIRASAVKAFIAEAIMTIDNEPTAELTENMCREFLVERKLAVIPANSKLALQFACWEKGRKGDWNYIQAGICVCPFCGASPHKKYKNFCPNCGADMRKGEQE